MKKYFLFAILSFLFATPAFATVGANTVWWVQTTAPAGNTSGGGFDTGATMDNTLSCTSATGTAPVCTSSNYTFLVADQGYWVYIQQGTNWTPGWYQINTVSGGAATLKADIGQALQFDTTKGSPYIHYQLNTVAGIATTASPTAGSWSMDYAKNDTALVSGVADLTIDATVNTKVTSATRTFGVNDIGNMIHITTGTSWTVATPYYEITSVASGAATLDRSPSAAGNANKATWYYGAASSLGSATANRNDTNVSAASSAGNRYLIKAGTYTLGATMTLTAGTVNLPTIIEGYNTTPGDAPTGSSRPTITSGANNFTLGLQNQIYNVSLTGSGTGLLTLAGGGVARNVKAVNTSTTAARIAIAASAASTYVLGCEAVSYRGIAIGRGAASGGVIDGNYAHDSDIGINDTGGALSEIYTNNIIADNVTAAMKFAAGVTGMSYIRNNTFYGAENKLGTGVLMPTAQVNTRLVGNIIYGFATGVSVVDTSEGNQSDYNDYFNNTANINDTTKWQMGVNDLGLNPTFATMGQYTGTNASVSGSVLTDSGANFANTTDNVDFVYISNGGVGPSTVGKYLITSHTSTTLTVDIAPTNSASGVAYQTTYGHDFNVGTNLKAANYPGAFPGGLTTGYMDIGAVQRQETGGGGGSSAPGLPYIYVTQ